MTTPQTYTQRSHPALAKLSNDEIAKFNALPPEVQHFFAGEENQDLRYGAPNDITKQGCFELAMLSNGFVNAEEFGSGARLWNAWRGAFTATQIDDSEYDRNIANFSHYDFREIRIDFSYFLFGPSANFFYAKFGDWANFFGANFGVSTCFSMAEFGESALFSAAQFGALSFFNGAYFGDNASFKGMELAEYEENLDVHKTWEENRGVSPFRFGSISFTGCIFAGSVSFANREFIDSTNFGVFQGRPVQFGAAPNFHGATLHQDTSFEGAIFPPDLKDYTPQGEAAMRAYRTLKLAFSKFDAKREEQRFFRYELMEEEALSVWYKKLLFSLYSFFSDYGFSTVRPFVRLIFAPLILMACIAGLMALSNGIGLGLNPDTTRIYLATIFQNAFPFVGDAKLDTKELRSLFGSNGLLALGIVGALQKILALIGWFLIGLALRNQFKMK